MSLEIKSKQQQVIDAANDPKIHTIVLIGTVGTGKTDVAAHLSISIAYQFPRTYWPVFRQNISTAKRSVIPSYFNMLELMNLEEGKDFIYNASDFTITFPHNKSIIPFIEADITKDRQGRKIKGVNATGNHIDEGDELAQTMFITATSRRGRRNAYGQPSLSIVTMNPNDTYMKEMYYDPWKAGTLPEDTVVIEFTIEDSWQSPEDIAALRRNPKPWVERYMNNNWDYHDDRDSLFKYRYFDAALVDQLDGGAPRYIGYDVAWKVGDRSVLALWYGKTLVDIQVVKDHEVEMDTTEQGIELIKSATRMGVIPENIEVDAVGGGEGVVSTMKSRGMKPAEFVSGATASTDRYDSLRSEVIHAFAQGLEKGEVKIYAGCPFRNELVSEAMLHNHDHDPTSKKLTIESKKKIKERTGGVSPDIFDAVVMGFRRQAQTAKSDAFEILL